MLNKSQNLCQTAFIFANKLISILQIRIMNRERNSRKPYLTSFRTTMLHKLEIYEL